MQVISCPVCSIICWPEGVNWRCPACDKVWYRAPMDSEDYGTDVLLDVTEDEQEEDDAR